MIFPWMAYKPKGSELSEVPHQQSRLSAPPLHSIFKAASHRNEAIVAAFNSGGYTLAEIADQKTGSKNRGQVFHRALLINWSTFPVPLIKMK